MTNNNANTEIKDEKEQNGDLTVGRIPKLIRQIALPVSIGFFFNTMFNVADTYFGGKISTEALAALSLSFPIFFLIIIFDSGTSTGTTSVIANALGAKEIDKARKYAAQSISFGLIIGIIITILGLIFSPSLFRLLGAKDSYLDLSLQFMNVIFYGGVFFMMSSVMNSALQATGNTRINRNFLIGGFILNVLLDPWFLYGGFGLPPLGLRGIALATVTVEFLGAIYISYHAFKTDLFNKNSFKDLLPQPKVFIDIAKQAIPASLNLATIGIGIFVITYFINHFGENAVAAYGIATRVEQIILLPTIGLTIATLTIVGQNNGAKKFDRVKETLSFCLRYGIIMMAIGGIFVYFAANLFMKFFTTNTEVVAIGTHYLHIAAFIFVAYPILFITVSALQGMKKPMFAVWIGIYRQILAPFVIFSFLIYKVGVGIDGVWWGIFAIVWSAAIITAFYGRYVIARLK